MNIVIEGADNSGKSTLAEVISNILGWKIVASLGPANNGHDFNQRALNFLHQHNVIFDRHCIVSEYIYGTMRGKVMTDPDLEKMYHLSSKIVVYCRTTEPTLEGHVIKPHDSPEHLAMVTAKQIQICRAYDQWALGNANIIYRKGEPPMRIVRFIMGELRQ